MTWTFKTCFPALKCYSQADPWTFLEFTSTPNERVIYRYVSIVKYLSYVTYLPWWIHFDVQILLMPIILSDTVIKISMVGCQLK